MMYSIIDVETTGKSNRITEISIFKYDGVDIIDSFTTLVNPENVIPRHITALTGIDDTMVADAPLFEDIAQQVLDITENTVFVAHNVNFDYNVIRNEFKRVNIDYNRKKLCTVRLSRTLLKGHASYSLGRLCKSLNISLSNRHRAEGDARATTTLFKLLLQTDVDGSVFKKFLNKNSQQATLPSHLPMAKFNALPNSAGIYLFKDKKGKVIYVGKAKDIKKRVLSHFYSKQKKSLDMCRETRDIDFELSGSELVALLMEDAAIKKYYPWYNSKSKRRVKTYGLFSYTDRNGILHLAYNQVTINSNPIISFHSIRECRSFMESICLEHNLCPKYCHLQEQVKWCSHYSIKSCKGICTEEETVEAYNNRVTNAILEITSYTETYIIKEKGRHPREEAFVLIEQGKYLGYGFIDNEEVINSIDDLHNFLIPQKDNLDIQKILRSYSRMA